MSLAVQDIAGRAREAGVVGAGGAGFPTHVKLASRVDTYIVNGAECEPLLYKDKELMRLQAARLVEGLRLAMDATRATRGIVVVKEKYHDAIAALKPWLFGNLSLHLMGNFYPAGDEYVVVYEATGRLIPPGGIPLQVGCAVNNVETLINVANAARGAPVTHKAITVAGAVARPSSFFVPVGVSARECIEFAGGATVDDPVVIEGGPMMGRVYGDLSRPVTKTTGGFIVLSARHPLVRKKTRPAELDRRLAAACDQCMQCTERCPRFLLGYAVEPHKVMRAAGFAGQRALDWGRLGLLCSECRLCELYSCPEGLNPASMCVASKAAARASGRKLEPPPSPQRPHPLREARKVPVPRLVRRLGLLGYDRPAPMRDELLEARRVRLLLKQHVGAPARPLVAEGERVRLGQKVADVAEGQLGAPVHASIDGRVERVDAESIWIAREDA